MENVHLYDVVERKYAGFSQIINDCFYGTSEEHPYQHKIQSGDVTWQRKAVTSDWDDKRNIFGLAEWLYVFIVHRITGSGINYAKKPSGYHNTILFHLHQANTVHDMAKLIKSYPATFYTSGGYQFPQFPKPTLDYKKGGDYYLCEFATLLSYDLGCWLTSQKEKPGLRDIIDFMLRWNVEHGLKQYKFQYAAVAADIADWFPELVDRDSMFAYGSNARECISYLATPKVKMKQDDFLDAVMEMGCEDLNAKPYNLEDCCCDFIRWISGYIPYRGEYDHLDKDLVWNSSKLVHPYGRQKAMLDLGMIDSFNNLTNHPTGDSIIVGCGVTPEEYRRLVSQ